MNDIEMRTLHFSARCFTTIQSLLSQVLNGLRDYDGRPKVCLAPLRGALAEVCLRDEPQCVFKVAPQSAAGEARERLLLQAYFHHIHAAGRDEGVEHDIRPLPLSLEGSACKQFADLFGDEQFHEAVPTPEGPGTSVKYAFALARHNRRINASRVATLDFLASLAPLTHFPEAGACASEARGVLYGRNRQFTLDMLKFAVVLGDAQTLHQVREEVCRPSFSERMSVIEYLQVDGRIPGKWLAGEEQNFRSEISARMALTALQQTTEAKLA
ncbi:MULTISPECIES: hypothetical protein [unclassified Variovorax]|uniref:hypothetical protein n=1 Tax=unclassified Variovorax TaxID=663243 RepID=UPI000A7978B8|nr:MULTISPECIES: hypothetical protein [unclassified Variovorax]PNG50106.1 hypothetical protein CHC06_05729 [Variovorax sp. B2]PNG50978.1 hypothetical protein CHC07_05634 [Variovorax sp. B4]VTV17140.1 hypothetical protein WDL1P1_00143 [Variovorax sp. WDL1]